MPKKSFAIEDLRRWQQRGLLSGEQLRSILAEEGLEAEPQAKERKVGLNLVTVAYYFGGLLAFFSFTFFVGMSWDDLTDWARLGVTLGAILVIGALGVWLRFMRGYPTALGAAEPSIDPRNVVNLVIFVPRPKADHVFEIDNLRAGGRAAPSATMPKKFFPFIDELGQYIHKDWPGKTRSPAELARRRRAEDKDLAAHPGPTD